MPDIRQSTVILDDFDRANESPIQPPWFAAGVGFWYPAAIAGNVLTGSGNPPIGSASYYSVTAYDGNAAEIWAAVAGEAPVTEGWRIGLMLDFAGPNTTDGYMCLPHNNVGTDTWDLRLYTNGGITTLDSVVQVNPSEDDLVLMRRNGGDVEVWLSVDAGANWTLIVSATDSTHTTGLYPVLGATTSGQCGWKYFGAGPPPDWMPQIYRRIYTTPRRRASGLFTP